MQYIVLRLLVFQWNEAFAEWLPDLVMDLDTQVVLKGNDQVPSNRKVVITTYDLIAKTVKNRYIRPRFPILLHPMQ